MSIKRLAALCVSLCLLLAILLCRAYWVATDAVFAANAGQQTLRSIELPTLRGNLYDCENRPLTGTTRFYYTLCVPGQTDYDALFPYVDYTQQAQLYENRNTAVPFFVRTSADLHPMGFVSVAGAERTLPLPIAEHLIGSLDEAGKGISGLEKAFDEVLTSAGDGNTVLYATNAQGTLLAGTEPVLQTKTAGSGYGVRLTLDAEMQRLCEGVADTMLPRGCVVVMETQTGAVRACVSRPGFDPENLAKSIAADDTSLLNRPLRSYCVGSVFKVVLAVAAYQKGLDWYTHTCTGSVEVDGQIYRCARGTAHGTVNLRGALAQSCNCYFIKLGQELGGTTTLAAADGFGFGAPCPLAPGFAASAGTLPEEAQLASTGQQAIFSFGQGNFTATPLQITAMTNAIANNGSYLSPQLVYGVVDETKTLVSRQPREQAHRVCDMATAKVLQSMLQTVVEEGIGTAAKPQVGTAAGKTGTAQTGQFDETGEELLNYWFSGFAPAETPQYTITVLQDAVLEPENSSAAIFAQIVEGLQSAGFVAEENS